MEQAIVVSVVLAPVVTALVQLVKRANSVNNRYLPLVAVVIGVVFGGGYAALFGEPVPDYLLGGLIAGLGAVGLYENISTTTKGDY